LKRGLTRFKRACKEQLGDCEGLILSFIPIQGLYSGAYLLPKPKPDKLKYYRVTKYTVDQDMDGTGEIVKGGYDYRGH
jgi:hypothetical protein